MKSSHFITFKALFLLCILLVSFPFTLIADEEESTTGKSELQPNGDISVNSITFCEDVKDRTPVNPGEDFPQDVERIYCFTDINCRLDEATIQHLWYLNGKLVSTIDLKVGKAENWRTWSYKTIGPEAVGKWEVVVKVAGGDVIKMGQFAVK